MYLIIPFEVKSCSKCGTYNLLGDQVCCNCGTDLKEVKVCQDQGEKGDF